MLFPVKTDFLEKGPSKALEQTSKQDKDVDASRMTDTNGRTSIEVSDEEDDFKEAESKEKENKDEHDEDDQLGSSDEISLNTPSGADANLPSDLLSVSRR